jgi:hypothetical protein
VLSPILSNVYLHHVLDVWFAEQVQPRLRGPASLVRYCDDFVMLFAYSDDADRVLSVLGKRLGKFGLQLHPDKTRLVDFRSRPPNRQAEGDASRATNFSFLGFTHIWARSRGGKAIVRQLTAKDRLARAIKAISQQCRRMRHWPIREQHQRLCRMLKGHYVYFGITGNARRLGCLRFEAGRCWRKWLARRSRERPLTWEVFNRILSVFPLPTPRIRQPYVTFTP